MAKHSGTRVFAADGSIVIVLTTVVDGELCIQIVREKGDGTPARTLGEFYTAACEDASAKPVAIDNAWGSGTPDAKVRTEVRTTRRVDRSKPT